MGYKSHCHGRKPAGEIGLGGQVHQRFFIPSYDYVTEISHNLEHAVTGGRHALGEIYSRRKRRNVKVYFPAGADYARKPPPCGNTGEQELGIKFAHLIFNWDEQCRFDDWIHARV
jgi:hypothetical protein